MKWTPAQQRHIAHLQNLGPRACAHFLGEVMAESNATAAVTSRLLAYAELGAELVDAVGGRDFAPTPLLLVPKDGDDD